MKLLYAFLGGAIVGTAAALLFAPEKGADLREQIRQILVKKGIIKEGNVQEEEIVDQIVAEIEAKK
ncbi:MAG: YtxH domain-containing protein [Bacteroidales bacterium]|nr:YtxH domain-containing protein [Bacteroidales bacterium]